MSTDKRRFRAIEVRQRGGNIHELRIDGVLWAEVEWSPSRRAFCIQDAAGHCLTHVEHIHATVADPHEAVRLARKMIMDGRIPTPEQAEARLRERLAAEHAASPAGADGLRVDTIAAQLEEIEQQRLADCWIEEAALGRNHGQPHDPAVRPDPRIGAPQRRPRA